MIFLDNYVHVRNSHTDHCSPDWRWAHTGDRENLLLLWIIQEGTGRLTVGDVDLDLKKGDVLTFPLWLPCRCEHNHDDPLTLAWVRFDYRDAHGAIVPIQQTWKEQNWPLHRRPTYGELIETLVLKAIDALQDHTMGRPIANKWIEVALIAVHEQDQTPSPSAPEMEAYQRIRALCKEIQASPERAWQVEELAKKVHYSTNHFARLFQRTQKITPKEFIVRARINKAKSLLRSSCYTVSQIADILGYNDVYHFSKQFKQKVGVPPREYRERG